jgi:hypothetical protein
MLDIHSPEPLAPEPIVGEVVMAIEKQKRRTPPGIDRMPTELVKAEGSIFRSEIRKLINSVWNKEELPEKLKESVVVPVYNKGNKTDCSNCRGISLLPTTYRILSNTVGDRLTNSSDNEQTGHRTLSRRIFVFGQRTHVRIMNTPEHTTRRGKSRSLLSKGFE